MNNLVNYFRLLFVVSLCFLTWRAYEINQINRQAQEKVQAMLDSNQDWYAVVYLGEEFEFGNFRFKIDHFDDPIIQSDSLYIVKLTEVDL